MSDLHGETRWLRDHWDDTPMRIHSRAIDDGSVWGAPAWSAAFASWLSVDAFATTVTEVQVECYHLPTGERRGCEVCGGTGMKNVASHVYRYPMRAALKVLHDRVHVPPGWVNYADALQMYRLCDWNIAALAARLTFPDTHSGRPARRGMTTPEASAYVLDAIRLLRGRYALGPVGRPREISDSQADAEAARPVSRMTLAGVAA